MSSNVDSWEDAMTPVDRSRSLPNAQHLKDNPFELNPYQVLNGPTDGTNDDLATQFAYCWTLQQFGLVSGANTDWRGPTMEYLETNELLFRFHQCNYNQLKYGHIIIKNRNDFETISKQDFTPVCNSTLHNWDGSSIRYCTWLSDKKTWIKMNEITTQAIATECKVTQELCDEIEVKKDELNVCLYISTAHISLVCDLRLVVIF